MKIDHKLLSFLATLGTVACSPLGTLPAVGFKGQTDFNVLLNKSDYQEHLVANLSDIENDLLPRLERRGLSKRWRLDSVTVGLGIEGEAGIGAVAIEGQLGVYLTFEKQNKTENFSL